MIKQEKRGYMSLFLLKRKESPLVCKSLLADNERKDSLGSWHVCWRSQENDDRCIMTQFERREESSLVCLKQGETLTLDSNSREKKFTTKRTTNLFIHSLYSHHHWLVDHKRSRHGKQMQSLLLFCILLYSLNTRVIMRCSCPVIHVSLFHPFYYHESSCFYESNNSNDHHHHHDPSQDARGKQMQVRALEKGHGLHKWMNHVNSLQEKTQIYHAMH